MDKKTVTVEATELLEPDVQFISLVKRGANRIPFRITKSENDSMINLDLSRIFKREKPPTVLAVIVNKAEVTDEVASIVKEAGFSIESPVKQDGCTIFKQHDSLDGAHAVKLNEDVAILMREDSLELPVAKAEESWAKEFYESMQCDGFYAAVGPATSYMQSTLSYALYKAESPEAAKKAAAEILGAYTDYTMSMVGAIPASAFKMAEAVSKSGGEEEEGESSQEEATKSEGTEEQTETSTEEKSVEKGEEEAEDSAADAAGDESDAAGDESVAESVEKGAEDPAISLIAKSLSDLTDMFKSLQTQSSELGDLVKSIQKENVDLRDKLDSVEVIAKSASQVVLGSETPDDTIGKEASAKAESFEIIDTAFQPNIRKAARESAMNSRYRQSAHF